MSGYTVTKPVSGLDVPGEPQPESRFFPPSWRCPHPERWHATDSQSTEVEVSDFVGGLVRALQPDLVVEIGSGFGQTTAAIAASLNLNQAGILVTLEPYLPRAAHVRERVPPGRWHLVTVAAEDWKPDADLPPEIDLLFSDGGHHQRVADAVRLRSRMRPGGLVAFHDTATPEVSDEIASLDGNRIDLPTPRGITLFQWRTR
jgi:predicted O-methyltransferase YrrM